MKSTQERKARAGHSELPTAQVNHHYLFVRNPNQGKAGSVYIERSLRWAT